MADKETGRNAASAAARTLRDRNATKPEKSAAASALAQTGNTKETGARAASAAGRTLGDRRATKAERSAAASALSQRSRRK